MPNYFVPYYFRKDNVRVTTNCEHEAKRLSQTEFNKFYIRGLCLYAIENNITTLEVYRAKNSENPRIESIQMIGQKVDVNLLLQDLRNNIGLETFLKLPQVNSGLSLKLIKD